jgi:hypothetical protein
VSTERGQLHPFGYVLVWENTLYREVQTAS